MFSQLIYKSLAVVVHIFLPLHSMHSNEKNIFVEKDQLESKHLEIETKILTSPTYPGDNDVVRIQAKFESNWIVGYEDKFARNGLQQPPQLKFSFMVIICHFQSCDQISVLLRMILFSAFKGCTVHWVLFYCYVT